jgi:hypothetical protein
VRGEGGASSRQSFDAGCQGEGSCVFRGTAPRDAASRPTPMAPGATTSPLREHSVDPADNSRGLLFILTRRRERTEGATLFAPLSPSVGIVGARQGGKTTLARDLRGDSHDRTVFFDLEDPGDPGRVRATACRTDLAVSVGAANHHACHSAGFFASTKDLANWRNRYASAKSDTIPSEMRTAPAVFPFAATMHCSNDRRSS